MGWKLKLAVVAALVAVVGVALWRLAPLMAPVREASSAAFWWHVCWVQVGDEKFTQRGICYGLRDGWLVYGVQHFHGQDLYRVRAAETLQDFPTVVEKLRTAPPGSLHPDVEAGYRAWLLADPTKSDAEGLLAKIREARLDRTRAQDQGVYELYLWEEEDFDQRWARAGRYSYNVLFEFVYLAGLIVFAAWPWLRRGGWVRWAVHLGLLPVLFFLPYWLGYAAFSFTSVGPSGGILYPYLLSRFAGLFPWTALDTWLMRVTPHFLEPLSQTPGPMLALSGRGGVGPVAATVLGLVLALAVFGIRLAIRYLSKPPLPEPAGVSEG